MLSQSDFLDLLWKEIINSNMDGKWVLSNINNSKACPKGCFADVGPILEKMLAARITPKDISLLARMIRYEACFDLLVHLEDPGLEHEEIDGIHESFLQADPSGLEGRPGSWPLPKISANRANGKGPRFTPSDTFHMVFSPDSKQIASAKRGIIWDTATLKQLTKCDLLGNTSRVAFSPDGNILAGINTSGNIAVCNSKTGIRLYKLSIGGESHNLFFIPDGKKIIAEFHGVVSIWDSKSGKLLCKKEINASETAHDGRYRSRLEHIHFCKKKTLITVYETTSGVVCRTYDAASWKPSKPICYEGFSTMCINPVNHSIGFAYGAALGLPNTSIALVKTDKENMLKSKKLGLESAAFSPNGKLIAGVSMYVDKQETGFYILDGVSLKVLKIIHSEYPNAVSFSPDGKWLALADWGKGQIWRVNELR